jgi:hypothetical protein
LRLRTISNPTTWRRSTGVLAGLAILGTTGQAQSQSPAGQLTVRVMTDSVRGLAGATVQLSVRVAGRDSFLAGSVSDSTGTVTFARPASDSVTLLVRRIGYAPVRRALDAARYDAPQTIRLSPAPLRLERICINVANPAVTLVFDSAFTATGIAIRARARTHRPPHTVVDSAVMDTSAIGRQIRRFSIQLAHAIPGVYDVEVFAPGYLPWTRRNIAALGYLGCGDRGATLQVHLKRRPHRGRPND